MQLEAALSVARELALEAVADKLGIEVSDDEVKALVREQAEAAGEDADKVIEDLWQHGRQEDLREDLRLRAALDRVAAEVKPIPIEQAAGARRDLDARQGKARDTRRSCGPQATE